MSTILDKLIGANTKSLEEKPKPFPCRVLASIRFAIYVGE